MIVFSERVGYDNTNINIISKKVGGAAHIVILSEDASWELTKLLGKRMSTFNGAIRLYQQGLSDATEDPFRHPLWMPGTFDVNTTLRQIVRRVLTAPFLERSDAGFHRYSAVRDAARHASRVSYTDVISSADSDDLAAAQEERDEWMSLAQSEEILRLEAERHNESLKADISRLNDKIGVLEFSLRQKQISVPASRSDYIPLRSYDELEDWAEAVLGNSVYIHQAALKDCKKNGHLNMIERIEKALLIIRDHITPARKFNDLSQRDIANKKLAEIGFSDSACFANRDEAKKRDEYSVSYGDGKRVMYDHLKYGTGYNNANQVRIYYFWDEEKSCHVVGKMPSHLPNKLTN